MAPPADAPISKPDAPPDPDVEDDDVDAVARAFVRRVGTGAVDVDFGDCDESQRLSETIPRGRGSQAEHRRWHTALEALDTKHNLTTDEFEAIESGAYGAAICSLEECTAPEQ